MIRRMARRPVAHFLALGAALFTLDSWWSGDGQAEAAAEAESLARPVEPIARLHARWRLERGGLPHAEELAALVDMESDEELLFRESRRLGLHRGDPLVRRRLVRNMRFVSDGPARSEGELFREALALGMDRTDLVVRRRLVQAMKLRAYEAARRSEPSAQELGEFLARHPTRFARPARVRLSHLYLSRERRGDALAAEARELLARLEGRSPEGIARLGDPFLLGHHLPPRSQRQLEAAFGPEFAASALVLAPGAWAGPIPSSYGLHLVWIHERWPPELPSLEAVRGEVRDAVLAARGEAELRRQLRALRARHGLPLRGGAG